MADTRNKPAQSSKDSENGVFKGLYRFVGLGGVETPIESNKENKLDIKEMRKQRRIEEQQKILVTEGVKNPVGSFPDFTEYCKREIRNSNKCNELEDMIKFEEWHPGTRTGAAKNDSNVSEERGPLLRFFLGRTPVPALEARKPECQKYYDEYKTCKKEWARRQRIAMREYHRRKKEEEKPNNQQEL